MSRYDEDEVDWNFQGSDDEEGSTEFRDKVELLFPGKIVDWTSQGRPMFSLRWESATRETVESPVFYADTGRNVDEGPRPCRGCGLSVETHDPDPCLGRLDGVKFACCGHRMEGWKFNFGWRKKSETSWVGSTTPYVGFLDERDALYGHDALRWFADHGVGPDLPQVNE